MENANRFKDKKIVLVSGGNAKYFDMLLEQAQSIRALDPEYHLDISFLDGGGFSKEQTEQFAKLGVTLIDPEFPSELARKKAGKKEYLKINLAKPALNKLFPNHDYIVFIDGDAWLQTLEAIDLSIMVADKNKLAIVSQNTRFRAKRFNFKKRLFGWAEIRTIFHKNAKRARLGRGYHWQLANMAVLNAGFYALRVDAPHWDIWTKWRDECIKKGRLFTSDQLSLALMSYIDELPFETLPERCNYMGPWRVNSNGNFVEAHAPYGLASVVHMAGLDAFRDDPKKYINAINMHDKEVKTPIRYCEWVKNKI